MRSNRLGNTELYISPIGIGTSAMGGVGWEFSFGTQNDDDCISAIHASLDHGINWIDTAAMYGLGHAEEIVGKAVRGRNPRPYVFTKCCVVWDAKGKTSNCLKASSIRSEIEGSLRRLKTDVIDLYQIHWPQPNNDIEEGWAEMAKLKWEGKVRYIGVSNFDVEQMVRAQCIAPITSLQPLYSLLCRQVEAHVLPFAQENNIGVIPYAPMLSGLLSGGLTRDKISNFSPDDFRRRLSNFREPRLSHNLEVAEKLRLVGERHARTAGEVAIAWVLRNPAVTGAIVGVRNTSEVASVIGAMEFRLCDAEAREIEQAAKRSLWQRIVIRMTEAARDLRLRRARSKPRSASLQGRVRQPH